ncbi:MAG: DUF421 domain-containing protein [Clostridia bacterium]|nr:DUF421 domain-containing protein [Clostridia bacterium]
MPQLMLKTAVLYVCVVIALRMMGKRQLGELQPSEFVISIMISDLATVPMESPDAPLIDGIVPIFTLVVLEYIVSTSVLKNDKIRRIVTGNPRVIVRHGKMLRREMARMRINLDDLLEQIRICGYSSIEDVDTAVLETNGQISIIPKENKRPLTPSDLGMTPRQTHLPRTLIADGMLLRENIIKANISEKWIKKQLGEIRISDVFYMSLSDGSVTIQIKPQE